MTAYLNPLELGRALRRLCCAPCNYDLDHDFEIKCVCEKLFILFFFVFTKICSSEMNFMDAV